LSVQRYIKTYNKPILQHVHNTEGTNISNRICLNNQNEKDRDKWQNLNKKPNNLIVKSSASYFNIYLQCGKSMFLYFLFVVWIIIKVLRNNFELIDLRNVFLKIYRIEGVIWWNSMKKFYFTIWTTLPLNIWTWIIHIRFMLYFLK
jgi:hypothetical protein